LVGNVVRHVTTAGGGRVISGNEAGHMIQGVQQVPLDVAMEMVKAYLRDHLADDLPVRTIARLVALSPFYLIRSFKAHVGVPPHRYLLQVRIERAMELLATSSLSVTQICHRVGFGSLSHFINTFRRQTGMSPLEYRRRASAGAAGVAASGPPGSAA
jgi:transcriptional regulator GlxA family with amidase domain